MAFPNCPDDPAWVLQRIRLGLGRQACALGCAALAPALTWLSGTAEWLGPRSPRATTVMRAQPPALLNTWAPLRLMYSNRARRAEIGHTFPRAAPLKFGQVVSDALDHRAASWRLVLV